MILASLTLWNTSALAGLCLALTLGSASPAASQQPSAQPVPAQSAAFGRAQLAEVIAGIQRLVREFYVDPALREPLAARLQQSLRSGRYDVDDPNRFAELVSEDLQAVSRDGHMGVDFDPSRFERLSTSPEADLAEVERMAIRANHGLTEMRILPGNVRYLRISGFEWVADKTGTAYDEAMRFLSEGDAVIIDVRGNGGGSASAVQYAFSHFMPADEEALLMTFTDDVGRPQQSRVLAHLPSGRLTGRPLYVLVDEGTRSAAEEFAYHVKHFNVGKLVGEKTAGAANNNAFYPVARGFIVSISGSRPVHAVTGTNWEGSGITPDTAVEPSVALDAAHADALEALAAAAPAEQRLQYAWLVPHLRARVHPVSLSEAELTRFVGRYGPRQIILENGALVHLAPDLPPLRLTPLAERVFAFPDTDQVRLEFQLEDDQVTALRVLSSRGTSRDLPRTQ
jgi:hypothetical protein